MNNTCKVMYGYKTVYIIKKLDFNLFFLIDRLTFWIIFSGKIEYNYPTHFSSLKSYLRKKKMFVYTRSTELVYEEKYLFVIYCIE